MNIKFNGQSPNSIDQPNHSGFQWRRRGVPSLGNSVNFRPRHPQKTKFRELLSNDGAIAGSAERPRKPAILAILRAFVNPKFRFYSEIPKKWA
jgi:hypothetical protein